MAGVIWSPDWENIKRSRVRGEESRAADIKSKLEEEARKQKIQDAINVYRQKLEVQKQIKGQTAPTITETSVERPYSEILQAQEEASRTPEEFYRAGMATGKGEPMKRRWGGIFPVRVPLLDEEGSPTNIPTYSEYELSPEARQRQEAAKTILGSPTRKTIKKTYQGQPQEMEAEELPDTMDYEEGTIIEDENNPDVRYQLINGEWVKIDDTIIPGTR